MVVISELTSIFWGVALEGSNKKYSQTTERPVHITMAALDPFQTHDENPVSLMIERDGRSFVLCTLQHGKHFQQPLDLEFASGEELIFFLKGKGVIHLSGYVMPEDEFPGLSDVMTDSDKEDEEEEEELESDEDVSSPGRQSKKRQKSDKETKKSSKKAKMTIEDIDEDDDDDDSDAEFIDDEAEEASEDDDEEEYEDDDDDDLEKELLHEDSDAESSDSDEEMDMKKAVTVDKKPNIGKKGKKTDASGGADVKSKPAAQTGAEKVNVPVLTTPATQPLSAAASDTPQVAEGKKKKKKKKKKNKNAVQQQQTAGGSTAVGPAAAQPSKRTVEGGIVVEDVKEGHGPEAKLGKLVRVYYTGRLANGKIFDSTTTGNGFKFKLGKKEVISGWDVGLSGMKVGGKRKLVIPAKMGYGSQQAGPIPPNSTLFFDVELRAVS